MAIQFSPITIKLVTRPNIDLDGERGYTFEIQGWKNVLVRKGVYTKAQASELAGKFRKFINSRRKAIESGKRSPYPIMTQTYLPDGSPIITLFESKVEQLEELNF